MNVTFRFLELYTKLTAKSGYAHHDTTKTCRYDAEMLRWRRRTSSNRWGETQKQRPVIENDPQ